MPLAPMFRPVKAPAGATWPGGVGEGRQEPGLGPGAAGVVDIGRVVAAAQDQLGALQVIDDAGVRLRLLAAQVDRVGARCR